MAPVDAATRQGERHVCVVGALPPPVHGMAMVTQEMLAAIGERARVTAINTSPRSLSRGARYHLRRGLAVARGLPRLAGARMRGARAIYMPLDEGLGGVWNLAFLLPARVMGMRVFLQHHSFRYLTARTRIMAAIVAMGGRNACHVALCPTMAARLRALYPRIGLGDDSIFVAPNPVATPPMAPPAPAPAPAVRHQPTIGMLANLTFEKGVAEFVALVEALPSVRGILAGPANGEVRAFIDAAVARLGPRLAWLGPVAGEDKELFFGSLDVFAFPTRYRTEAYPLVLAEALVRGVAVVAPARGCIGALAGLDAARVIPIEEEFVAGAADWLRQRLAASPDRAAVRGEGEALNRTNAAIRARLVAAIADAAVKPAR